MALPTKFPGKCPTPFAALSDSSASSTESAIALKGAATKPPTAATGTHIGDVMTVKNVLSPDLFSDIFNKIG